MKYKWFTQFDKAFVLVPSWLSPWLMAMSAKSRLECSLLVVVVGVSICDTILGGTKQTRHAAWILCKVMSRIGNFCGAVRGYFHNVMHTSEELLWLFYILSLFFYHPLTWNMFWQCMAMLHPKDCMQFHTSSVAQSISNRRWVNTAGETYWFNMIYSNLMLVVFLLFLGFDMLHSCNAGAQSPSESFGNNVQKITAIVHLNAHGRKSDISNLVGQSTIDWGSKIFFEDRPGGSRPTGYRIPAWTFTLSEVWSLQVVGFEELPDHLLLIGVPYPVELSATHLHTYYLVGQALGCNWFCLGQGSW